ncbi:hypothetical protein ACFORG_12775 [Lutimaribacter marinistellae]|uniref:Uncharacterized protein n=1 Tax=Lutimaribacter marinistellae TaxID=1820329 RepID=A0ABV7TH41_9RHOB
MPEYHSFDHEAVNQALQAARAAHEDKNLMAMDSTSDISDSGELSLLAECIAVTVSDHKVCLDLPLGIGKVCIPIPIKFPDGEAAKACLSICTTWGIPTGVKVSISIGGITVVEKKFGKC